MQSCAALLRRVRPLPQRPLSRKVLELKQDVPGIGTKGQVVQLNNKIAFTLVARQAAEVVTYAEMEEANRALTGEQRQRREYVRDFWRIQQSLIRIPRRVIGPDGHVGSPVDAKDVADHLWRIAKILVHPDQVEFMTPARVLEKTGYHYVWVRLFGGEGTEGACWNTERARLRVKIVQDTHSIY
eukprot:TRINITY_DN9581_c0_g1_i1.p2 TRINITY_DN9581_c0_g1~~TRINITY_DN9581_c0_g1_i1.p2  ORF type:complete len:184 (+),score=38.07 TRINITY_DN9581_c0_g1_i1:100-651(+)